MGTSKWTDATKNFWTSKWEGLHRHEMKARNCCVACRDVFSWHDPRQRPVWAQNWADTNRIDGL